MPSEPAFMAKARSDRLDLGFPFAQSLLRGMDRVVAHHEIVRMRYGRSEHELGIAPGLELHTELGLLECDQLLLPNRLAIRQQAAFDGCDPKYRMIFRRHI